MLIDMHAHVIPAEFPGTGEAGWPRMEPADRPDARVLVTPRMRFTAAEVFYAAEARLAAMDANGVDAEVVSPMPPLLDYQMAAKSYRDLSLWINEYIAGLCATDPRRFFGLGTVPLQDPDLAAEELSRLREMGLHGIEIGSNVNGVYLGDERLRGFLQEADRLQIPIFVHAFNPMLDDRLPASAMATFGFAGEIGLAAASLISTGTADACPGLRLAFSHGAAGFSLMLTRAQWFWGRTWNEEPTDAEGISPAEYARRFYYDTLVFDRRALRYLIDMLGPDRLLIGTDFPAMPREEPAGRTLRSMDLPAETLDAITWHNCFRFLGVPRPDARPESAQYNST